MSLAYGRGSLSVLSPSATPKYGPDKNNSQYIHIDTHTHISETQKLILVFTLHEQ